MVTISSRIELGGFGTYFGVCGGDSSVDFKSFYNGPKLRISHIEYLHRDDAKIFKSPLDRAEYVDRTDGKSNSDTSVYFRQNMSRIVRGEDESWRLLGFEVMPDGVRLLYYNRELYRKESVEIRGFAFSITIDVPESNKGFIADDLAEEVDDETIDRLKLLLGIDSLADYDKSNAETFEIKIAQCSSAEYYACIWRSGETDRYYELWEDHANTIFTPNPKNWFTRWLAERLFPDYYEKRPGAIEDQFNPTQKTYMKVCNELPIISKRG